MLLRKVVGTVKATVGEDAAERVSTAEFVTFSATTETPPQNQRKIGQL